MKQSTLWVLIQRDLSNLPWALFDPNGKLVFEGTGNLAALRAFREKNMPHVLNCLIGQEDFYVRQVEVPQKTSYSKLTQMLPYLLEEDLLEDLEDVGIYPLKQAGETVDVLVYDKSKLHSLFDLLKSNQLNPDWVGLIGSELPDWSVYHMGDMAHVNVPGVMFSSGIQASWEMLYMAYDQAQEKPEKIVMFGKKIDFEVNPPFVVETNQMLSFFSYLNKKNKSAYNILDLSEKEASKKPKVSLYSHVTIMASLLFFILFGIKGYEFYTFNKLEKTLQVDIDGIYFKLYPNAKSVVAPRTRMEQELHAGVGSAQNFIYLLYNLGQSLKQYPQMSIHAIQFRDNRLDVDLVGKDYEGFDKVMKDLSKKPIKVSQKSTTKQGEEVRTSLHLERGAL